MDWLSGRATFARDLAKHNVWGPFGLFFSLAWSIVQQWRDEWADTSVAEKWRAVSVLPSPLWWLVVGLAVLAFWLFESAYQRQKPLLSVYFGDPRAGVEWENNNAKAPVIHFLILTIKNGRSSKLDECQVQIWVRSKVHPGLETINFFICPPFSLRPDEQVPVRLLSYELDLKDAQLSIRKYHRDTNEKWVRNPSDLRLPVYGGAHHITIEVLSAQSKIARTHVRAAHIEDRWRFSQNGRQLFG